MLQLLGEGTIIGSDLVFKNTTLELMGLFNVILGEQSGRKSDSEEFPKVTSESIGDHPLLQSNLNFRSWVCVPSLANYKC